MQRITRTAGRFVCFVMLAALLAPDVGALPVPGAALWVDASTLSAGTFDASTAPVSNLGTQGGSFTAGPYSVNATGINGRAALQFNGTSDYLKSTNAYTNSGTTLTLFVVEKRITEQGGWKGSVSCTDGGTNTMDNEVVSGFALNQDDSTPRNLLIARALNPKAAITHPGNGTPFISTVVFDSANCTHYLKTSSGSSTNSTGSSGNFGITSTVLGSRQRPLPTSENNYANINIGEVLIYNSALSDSDRLAVESYLAVKWGIVPEPMRGGVLIVR